MEDIKTIDLGALRALAKQRSLVMEELFTLVENALLLAYMKQPGAIKGSRAVIDRTTGEFVILAPELDEDNQKIDEFDDTPNNFGRIAAATVRQVLSQRLRDAEDASVLGEFKDREGTLVSGVIQQGNNPRMVQVDLGTVEAVLPSNEQVPGEKYLHGTRLRAYLVEARRGPKGPSIVVSRSHPNLVLRLFEHEVPEISELSHLYFLNKQKKRCSLETYISRDRALREIFSLIVTTFFISQCHYNEVNSIYLFFYRQYIFLYKNLLKFKQKN